MALWAVARLSKGMARRMPRSPTKARGRKLLDIYALLLRISLFCYGAILER